VLQCVAVCCSVLQCEKRLKRERERILECGRRNEDDSMGGRGGGEKGEGGGWGVCVWNQKHRAEQSFLLLRVP